MDSYLKDNFVVQGTLFSSNCFLILTEGTLYLYENENQYMNGQIPIDILNLRMYNISIAQKDGKVLTVVNMKNQDKQYVFYSNRKEQVNIWFNEMKKSTEKYEEHLKDVFENKKQVIPFEKMQLNYSIDMKNDSFDSALIQQ